MKIYFVTANKMKFEIAQAYFEKISGNYELIQCEIDTPEIQHESVEEIARYSAVWAAKETGEPCIKMDVGFFISALNGFPGPFVKYANDWLAQDDFLKLMEHKDDRSAHFEDCPLLISATTEDKWSRGYDELYRAIKAKGQENVELKVYPGQHVFSPEMREYAYKFLGERLK